MGGEHMLSTKTSVKSELPFDTRKPVARANGALRGHAGEPLQLFSTCPQSFGFDKESYARQVRKVARWSERCGCQGILVYTDNSLVDPWLVSEIIVESTKGLSPLVAIQPVYMHPYSVAKMMASLPGELLPEIFVSGSSDAGMDAAKKLGATAVKYPRPTTECAAELANDGLKSGIRVGIIARETEEEAWEIAEQRFPEDRKGELTHQLAMRVSDSLWHKQLCDTANKTRAMRTTYWLRPFEQYKTFCPYLVGGYEPVSNELSRYISLGYRTFILDIPPDEEELKHAAAVFDRAAEKIGLAV